MAAEKITTDPAIDRSAWGPGPWNGEPDRIEWRTAAGFVGLLRRSKATGALCGYVGLPPAHPWHGQEYDAIDVDVHGGLTYAAPCAHDVGICHVPAPGEPDDLYWLGFDAGHAWDVMPAFHARNPEWRECDGTYRDLAYMREQCERLAEQAARASAT